VQISVGRLTDVDDLEGDVLALPVAIRPQDQPLRRADLALEGFLQPEILK
jgi:hypothetical protein